MSDVEVDSVWIHCTLPDDDFGDLEATPRRAPLSRIHPLSIGVDSLVDGGDTLTETQVLACADDSDTDVIPETSESSQATSESCITQPTPDLSIMTPPVTGPPKSPPPIEMAPPIQVAPRTATPLPTIARRPNHPSAVSDLTPRPAALMPVFVPRTVTTAPVKDDTQCTTAPPTAYDTAPWLVATQLVDDPTPSVSAPAVRPVSAPSEAIAAHPTRPLSLPLAAMSPLSEVDILAELDFRRRQEEQETARLAEEQAEMRLADEYEQASQERLRSVVRMFEDVSSDEATVPRASTTEDTNSDVNENESPPQTLYCVARAQYLVKRRSRQNAPHKYPVKRGGDPSDPLVVVKYPDINAEFTVRRFGLQEMDTRHGEVSKFRRAWLSDYQADQRGYHGDSNLVSGIRLYYTDCIYRAQLVLPDVYEEMYYVDLFFRNKFYSAFGKQQPGVTPPQQYHAWCNFVNAYIGANSREANAYENSLRGREERFYSNSVPGVAMKIHALSMKKEILCTVPVDVECPSCYPGSSRGAIEPTSPSNLVALHARLHELLTKQKRNTAPAAFEPNEQVQVERLESELSKLQADAEWQRNQIVCLTNESKERSAEYEGLQARNASLQANVNSLQANITSLQGNIAAEVATQLSRHFRAMSGSVLSNYDTP